MDELNAKIDQNAFEPTRAYPSDAGLDIRTPVSFWVLPKCRKRIDTGVHVAIPDGYVGMLTSKSGLMHKHGILTTGTIDSSYRGSIKAVVFNQGWLPVQFRRGQKVTQLVIEKIITPEVWTVDQLNETDRGCGGFGSTGR